MSAAAAVPCVLRDAFAVAASDRPVWRAKPIEGYAFYRRHSVGLLHRYLRASMEMGRSPCVLGNVVFRGRVSSYRIGSFEDIVIFDLCVLKNQMTVLVGDGNAGRIGDLEERVTQHEQRFQNVRGVAIAFGALLTLVQLMIDFLRKR